MTLPFVKTKKPKPGYNGMPLELDAYGTRMKREKNYSKPVSFYENRLFGLLLTIFFIFTDYCCLNISWTNVQEEGAYFIALMAVGCAIVLDFPLAFAGYVFKKYSQGIASRQTAYIALGSAVVLFLLVFIFQYDFRIATQNMTFKIGAQGMLQDNMATADGAAIVGGVILTADEKQRIIASAGRFSGMLPLFTSIASFVFSYCSADPLGDQIHKINKYIIVAEAHLAELDQIIEELGGNISHNEIRIHEAGTRWDAFVEETTARNLRNQVAARTIQISLAFNKKRMKDICADELEEAAAIVESTRLIVDNYDSLRSRYSGRNEADGKKLDLPPIILPESFAVFDRRRTA